MICKKKAQSIVRQKEPLKMPLSLPAIDLYIYIYIMIFLTLSFHIYIKLEKS